MKTIIALLSITGLCAAPLSADCRRVVRVQQVVEVQQVVTPVVAAVFQPVSVAAYSVGYGAAQDLTPLLEELRAMRQELQAIRTAGAGGPINDGAIKPDSPHVALIRQNCAACHGVTPKGNGISFFNPDGSFKEPDGALLGKIIAQVGSGAMPKGAKMIEAERLRLITGLVVEPTPAASAKMPPAK